jgi:arylsulfatase A-like enzyme
MIPLRALLVLLAVSLVASVGGAQPRSVAVTPNVLFILIDDLGWRDFGCYGSTLYETPHLDRMAAQGVRFTDAYAAYPRCVPSRFGIVTGKHPASFQGPSDAPKVTPGRDVTIGAVFAAAGYETFYNGKWHLGDGASAPRENGFATTVAAGAAGATRSHFAPYAAARRGGAGGGQGGEEKAVVPDLDDAPQDEYLADRQTKETIKFLRRNRDRPFFALHAFYAVHTPLQGKDEYAAVYRDKLAARPKPAALWEKESAGENLLVQNHPVYAAMVQSVDENVGRLLAELETLKLADDTIVVVFSDNGGLSAHGNNREVATSNRPLRAGKGHLYEGGVRVPLLIRWPGRFAAGRTESSPVIGTDFLPTLAELAGIRTPLPRGVDGRSFAGVLRGEKPAAERPLFWHNPAPRPTQTADVYSSAVRLGRLKLIDFPEQQRVELYDLTEDPSEARNLAETRPADRDRLLGLLNDWRKSVGASAPRANRKKR